MVRCWKQQLQVTPKLYLASRNTAYAQKVLYGELQADRLKYAEYGANCEKEYIVETGSSSCPFLFGEIGDFDSVIPNHKEEKTRFKWLSIQIEHRWNARMSKFTNSRPEIRIHITMPKFDFKQYIQGHRALTLKLLRYDTPCVWVYSISFRLLNGIFPYLKKKWSLA